MHIDVPAILLLLTPRLSSSPEKVKDLVTGTTRRTPKQNRLLSALEAFYYCIVLLGGDVNSMNKQAVGLLSTCILRENSFWWEIVLGSGGAGLGRGQATP
jgi:hypothetical protein